MNYAGLLSVAFPGTTLSEQSPEPLPSELELQAIWFSGGFGRSFRTLDGKQASIVQFGEWNRTAGPDFIQAVIELDGETRAGAIELDPTSEDWEHHGHATNPSYLGVVLHVVFQRPRQTIFTRNSDHREVPVVVIDGTALEDALNKPRATVAIAKPGRCVQPLAGMDSLSVAKLLEEAALHRASRKATRMLLTAAAHGRDAALYQSTAETLGYRGNSLAMRLLAQRAPLAALKVENSHEALLFGTAGFLSPKLHEKAPADTRDYLRDLWDTWWKQRGRFEPMGERDLPWSMHGHRPANHPHRRVGALSALVGAWPKYRRIALARPFKPKAVLDFLATLDHPFWERRYTLTAAPAAKPLALFGKSQALELLANHLVPLALHEDPEFTITSYLKLPATVANDRVKRCALRLFGSLETAKPWLSRLAHHQALLQIYHDFCLQDTSDCAACPFPEQLAQWHL